MNRRKRKRTLVAAAWFGWVLFYLPFHYTDKQGAWFGYLVWFGLLMYWGLLILLSATWADVDE
jgi:hypothetical protein